MGNIKTYRKDVAEKLSKNFNSKEFDCHGKGCCSETQVDEQLVEYVQKIRDHFGKPVNISSGYRCAKHNKNVGGATGSRHAKGQAADIYIDGIAPAEIAKYAESIGIKGIGLYETKADGFFVHVDTRPSKSFWYGQAQAKRTTFQEVKEEKPTENSANPTEEPKEEKVDNAHPVLRKGSSGEKVKELQKALKVLGFDCKKVDGYFGNNTYTAVVGLQKERNLDPDGVCGPDTWKAIEEFESYKVKVTASKLNVRSGPGLAKTVKTVVAKDTQLVLVYAKDGWGKIENGVGWVSLEYVARI